MIHLSLVTQKNIISRIHIVLFSLHCKLFLNAVPNYDAASVSVPLIRVIKIKRLKYSAVTNAKVGNMTSKSIYTSF